MSGEDARPLIPNHEHRRQAERGRRQGSLPVRVSTLVDRSKASRACPADRLPAMFTVKAQMKAGQGGKITFKALDMKPQDVTKKPTA